MKQKHTFLAHILVGVALLVLPVWVAAAEFRGGEQTGVRAGEAVNDDLYLAGGTVTGAGNVLGDLYAGGGTVLISGSVSQDVVAGGGTVTVLGEVSDDVRVAGGTVIVQGTVGDDVVVGGGQVHLSGARIGGDVLAGAGVLRLDSPVSGNVRVGGGEIYLDSLVAGSVEVDADQLTLGPNAIITGDLIYRSSNEMILEDGAQVLGATHYEPLEARNEGASAAALFSLSALAGLLMLLAGTFFFGLLFRRYMEGVVQGAWERPLLEFGRGFAVLVILPIASILLLVLVVGVPLGILGLLTFAAAILISFLVAPIVLGSMLFGALTRTYDQRVNWKTILLGVVGFYLLGFVPFVGWLVQFVFVLLALGSMVRMKLEIARQWR